MEHVQMDEPGERRLHPRQRVARLEQRHVERLAVESDQAFGPAKHFGKRGENRLLLRIIAQEKLPHDELARFHGRHTDQEGYRARSASQAGGLGVEESEARGFGQARRGRQAQRCRAVPGGAEEDVERLEACSHDVADAQAPVGPPERQGLACHEEFAEIISLRSSFHVFFDPARGSFGRELLPALRTTRQVRELPVERLLARTLGRSAFYNAELFFEGHGVPRGLRQSVTVRSWLFGYIGRPLPPSPATRRSRGLSNMRTVLPAL